ncbi:beta-1,4-N-acetylgalactosaminyltransferase bre-4-like [Haliotis rufescens]|uniref:beta-1,4-N-acetylgalactosaminyltransferase bre-4-like n=1 Tax=Haliotis rufescens TaxID=6454 RepID=UPI00201F605F|nr:beta-1,4-N-acetylgalactosaminyltransferase bre-4-like [Haliotis rufescens]XP_048240029.1 beta-1,4-N-acetylgalactosaminyltransferase bre-4-like [Haliotis rufescens]XP_048240030.1 beta-1,4-N-acetylgalactosaminyltransferase bre-4-like [Haliotis rufescens]
MLPTNKRMRISPMAVIRATLPYIRSFFVSRFMIVASVLACLLVFEFAFNFMIHFNSTSGMSMYLRGFLMKQKTNISGNSLRHLLTGRPNRDSSDDKPRLPLCPLIPSNLEGPVKVDKNVYSNRNIEAMNSAVKAGGRWWPDTCTSRHHVAIIIPFRDRPSHLKIFMTNIHHFLQRQELDYGIFVVEPVSDVKFNRAMLFNIGYAEAIKQHNYTCFIFHDVDLIPEDDRNLYTCPEMPRHMSVAIDKLKYKLPYTQIFGGVSALTQEQFIQVNGFSNKYFGWGGEDDDMFNRIHSENFNIMRYSSEVARYKMLSHAKDEPNPQRHKLLKGSESRYKTDGLNSLKYAVLRIELRKLYTWILVDINEKEVMQDTGPDKKNMKS